MGLASQFEGNIVREIKPVPKARTTGLLTEVAPGRLLAQAK